MNRSIKAPISFFLMLVLLISTSACNTLDATTTVSASNKVVYKPDTLFLGIYFGEGPVAARFPEVWNHELLVDYSRSTKNLAEVAKVRRAILDKVKKLHPDFIKSFSGDVQSGDVLRVRDAFYKGNSYVLEAVEALYPEVMRELEKNGELSSQQVAGPIFIAVAAVVLRVAILNGYIAANLVAIVNLAVEIGNMQRNTSGLTADMYMNWIAERLKGCASENARSSSGRACS